MKRSIALLCGALTLAACGENSNIEEAVRENLIDPDSAKFGEIVRYTDKDDDEMACVMVNAKNRMGGYTGESIVTAIRNDKGEWRALGSGPEGYDCTSYIELIVR
jgi:hypothetical protein